MSRWLQHDFNIDMMFNHCIKFDLRKKTFVGIIIKEGKIKTASYNHSQILETNSSFHMK